VTNVPKVIDFSTVDYEASMDDVAWLDEIKGKKMKIEVFESMIDLFEKTTKEDIPATLLACQKVATESLPYVKLPTQD
jgi:hypothetical protein